MKIREKIRKFTSSVLDGQRRDGGIKALIEKLDELPILVYFVNFGFDMVEYPDPPARDYAELRRLIKAKFPTMGFYNTVDDDGNSECACQIVVGDAIDDLVDIIGDLLDVEWFFANTSEADAFWHFENSYQSHWGRHLRELQLHLYKRHD